MERNGSNDRIRKHHLKPSAISSMGKDLIMISILISRQKHLFFAFSAISIKSRLTCKVVRAFHIDAICHRTASV